ncbi:MAG: hypothetical protein EOO06_00280 [Chitinophagaceae bacterium]|nr:MAG: hypothetical protein EOO06_00280 [Chitinophagaceae bacterium]
MFKWFTKKKDVPVVSEQKKRLFYKIGKYRTTESARFLKGFAALYSLLSSYNDSFSFRYSLLVDNTDCYGLSKITLVLKSFNGYSNDLRLEVDYTIQFVIDEWYSGKIDFFTKHFIRFFKANGYDVDQSLLNGVITKKNKSDKNV